MRIPTRFLTLASITTGLTLGAACATTSVEKTTEPDSLGAAAALAEGGEEDPGQGFRDLLSEDWKALMAFYPEWGTYLGMHEHRERWTDYSEAAIEERKGHRQNLLELLRVINRDDLEGADAVNYDLFVRETELEVDAQRFPGELMPITQLSGPLQGIPRNLKLMPRSTVADYEAILTRLGKVPTLLTQVQALLAKGVAQGVTPPKVTLRDVPAQAKAMLTEDPMASPILGPFAKFPDSIPEAEQVRLKQTALDRYNESVKPSLERFAKFLEETYVPGARETIGAKDLPNGEDWYAHRVREYTTTKLSPREIHEIGLAEVKRIRGEMDKVIAESGFEGDFAAFTKFLREDPQFFHETAEALLTGYRDIAKRADGQMPRLFGKLPRLPYGVKEIPAHAAKSQTTAYYQGGSYESGRAGNFFANTYDLKSRPKWEMEALTLHEAVPGHHHQIALAAENGDLPEFRRFGGYTAFVEGWGLYAESLGEEMGFYQDPYSKFGQLTYEMWRAVRLVVDTGMHALGWSREQAIEFFQSNTGKAKHDIVVEIDRYIVWPGQALAYKIGELKIKELRAMAEKALGEKFDIRAFHDELLSEGALPLDVLETRMKAWVARQQG